jgi:O-antigen ligase
MIIWTVLAVNIITVIDALNLIELGLIQERQDGRIGGPVGESNQYAAFLALFLPPTLALALIEHGFRRVIVFVGFGISVLAFLMTASRGGVVGIVMGAAIGGFLLRGFVTARSIAVGFAVVLILAPIALLVLYFAGFGDLFYDRFIETTTAGNSWTVSSGRNEIWGSALSKMLESPVSIITGFGWDTYQQAFIFRYAPHNTYLKFFFELGSIGLILILVALVNIVRIARACLTDARDDERTMIMAFIIGFLGILVAIFFVDLTRPWILIWAFVGILMRVASLAGQPQSRESRRPVRSSNNVGVEIDA